LTKDLISITLTVGVILMRVTEKGQVTIPLAVREALGIVPGSEVEFHREGDHAVLRRVTSPLAVKERLVKYAGRASTSLSTEDILALTRS
jgi:AbrB family looped-hinge helix DNA binding protein